MTRVTLRDVAAHAGVSHQTVSNVMNGHPSIRPATRDRVLAAIQALDYHPNQAAKALREARVTTLCCAFYGHDAENVDDPYRNVVQSAFIAEANVHGYSMTTAFVQDGPESFDSLRQRYRQGQFGGVVVVGNTLNAAQWQALQGWGLPAVLFDHRLPDSAALSVSSDYTSGMHALVAHHAAQGRRHLALIIPLQDAASTAVDRREAFRAAAAQHGLQAHLIAGDWSYASGEAALHTLWRGGNSPDAVLGGNDRMAAGALRAALELGLRVPGQVAISGFDNFEFSRYTHPSLTTVNVPHAEMARRAVRALLARLEQHQTPPNVVLPASLVIRESA
ncbi:LacI family DNA-binding transcriptional regulator [Deinococcus koreensis]|nr:LacI family DNA-binding transcriptional regulator [Deinococcus koreensis]